MKKNVSEKKILKDLDKQVNQTLNAIAEHQAKKEDVPEWLWTELTYRIGERNKYREGMNVVDKNEWVKATAQTVGTVAGLLGLSMVLGFEKTDVVTSKGFGIATKLMGK